MTASGDGSSRSSWRTPRRPPGDGQRIDFGTPSTASSSTLQRLPMEQVARAVWRRQLGPPLVPAVVQELASSSGSGPPWSGVRRPRGGRLEAGRRPTAGWSKARFGGEKVGKNPTDRGKPGTKKSVLVEADGGPLGVVVAGANVPDFKLLDETIEAVMAERPDPKLVEQHLAAWTPAMTTPRPARWSSDTATSSTSGRPERGPARSGERAVARPVAGWWSGRWPGCPVPGSAGALRQAWRELPGANPVGLRAALVPKALPTPSRMTVLR